MKIVIYLLQIASYYVILTIKHDLKKRRKKPIHNFKVLPFKFEIPIMMILNLEKPSLGLSI